MRGEIKGKKLLIMCGTQHGIKMGLLKLIVGGAHSRKTILYIKVVLHCFSSLE